MEKIPDLENPYQKAFESYMRYFPLSEEDLQKPILDVESGTGEFIEYVRTMLGNQQAFAVEKQQKRLPQIRQDILLQMEWSCHFKTIHSRW